MSDAVVVQLYSYRLQKKTNPVCKITASSKGKSPKIDLLYAFIREDMGGPAAEEESDARKVR